MKMKMKGRSFYAGALFVGEVENGDGLEKWGEVGWVRSVIYLGSAVFHACRLQWLSRINTLILCINTSINTLYQTVS